MSEASTYTEKTNYYNLREKYSGKWRHTMFSGIGSADGRRWNSCRTSDGKCIGQTLRCCSHIFHSTGSLNQQLKVTTFAPKQPFFTLPDRPTFSRLMRLKLMVRWLQIVRNPVSTEMTKSFSKCKIEKLGKRILDKYSSHICRFWSHIVQFPIRKIQNMCNFRLFELHIWQ